MKKRYIITAVLLSVLIILQIPGFIILFSSLMQFLKTVSYYSGSESFIYGLVIVIGILIFAIEIGIASILFDLYEGKNTEE